MNLLTMRNTVRTKIGSPSVSDVSQTTLDRLCNAAYREIASKYPFNEVRCIKSFNTALGTSRYDLPLDVAALFRVWNDTEKMKLSKKGVRFLATARKNVPAGKPRYYVRVKNFIQLMPEPSGIYNIHIFYLTEIADMVADGDEPVIPLPWHDGIVLKARHLFYDERGDIGKAIYAKNEWKDWVSDKPSEIDLEKDDLEDGGVIVAQLGGEHSRSFGGQGRGSNYRNYPSSFDYED